MMMIKKVSCTKIFLKDEAYAEYDEQFAVAGGSAFAGVWSNLLVPTETHN